MLSNRSRGSACEREKRVSYAATANFPAVNYSYLNPPHLYFDLQFPAYSPVGTGVATVSSVVAVASGAAVPSAAALCRTLSTLWYAGFFPRLASKRQASPSPGYSFGIHEYCSVRHCSRGVKEPGKDGGKGRERLPGRKSPTP